MDRPEIDSTLFHRLITRSFTDPLSFSTEVDRQVTRNRSLSSSVRREWKDRLFRSMRWRRRLWGDIPPSKISMEVVDAKLLEAESLKDHPPLAKWRPLSMDALSRELSYPTWLVESCVHAYGFTQALSMLLALNDEAPTTLRVNTLKTTRETLVRTLRDAGHETQEGRHSPWAVHLHARVNVRSLREFKRGWFDWQDEGSQLSVLASGARRGHVVVDACAGAGGKTLALASLMDNQGRIISLDADSRPLAELRSRAQRAGVSIAEAKWIAKDDPEPVPELEGRADVVFVDAPCSSLGTLRRRPWLKWYFTKAAAEAFPAQQLALLLRFARLVKEGGSLHYVTCTIHPLENRDVVATFMRRDPRFKEAEPPRLLSPHVEGTDGFFMARLIR